MLPPIDLDRYPLHLPESTACKALVAQCKADLARDGMFNLEGFMLPEAIARTVAETSPRLNARQAFTHARRHNIYFKPMPDLPAGHPALKEVETRNYTLCADQCEGTPVDDIYSWQPLADFLACTMDHDALYPMPDPLARFNVMGYPEGWGLNWHFDRSQFTTTLLLQAPLEGGEFIYRSELRTDDDPNYDGVAKLLNGDDPEVKSFRAEAGTLNVFKGKNTAHRVAPVIGQVPRIVTVFTYYDRPGVMFTKEERMGFYGREA
ncbi:HalD/BesD family halogenase [Roseobacter sp. EG26]|uniref:HalD/BesD family halogenase n=1 Tax=Roseobacter sp. EG26 TaxID=3412477 RepID=UPI003CE5BE08